MNAVTNKPTCELCGGPIYRDKAARRRAREHAA